MKPPGESSPEEDARREIEELSRQAKYQEKITRREYLIREAEAQAAHMRLAESTYRDRFSGGAVVHGVVPQGFFAGGSGGSSAVSILNPSPKMQGGESVFWTSETGAISSAPVLKANETAHKTAESSWIIENVKPKKFTWFEFKVRLYLPLFKLAYRRNLLTLRL